MSGQAFAPQAFGPGFYRGGSAPRGAFLCAGFNGQAFYTDCPYPPAQQHGGGGKLREDHQRRLRAIEDRIREEKAKEVKLLRQKLGIERPDDLQGERERSAREERQIEAINARIEALEKEYQREEEELILMWALED